ncbi:alpha/beta hydrolase [Asanoa sp. WMMD1127]|uniref:alpha/beta fold hydrolase n=1 Tax=Asanoa sp. WMMD1127 TaxID=3016107 RepID=UPI002416CF29|nr:alpha/beta hydrolase [Asanoa sp. WMMD1127]MDG4820633.1 alpha/beta hydrolase [Asanoa sp. WMMD1127]
MTIRRHSDDPVITALSALAPDAGFTRGELERTGGRRLRWVESATAGPTILLAAGAGDTVLDWGTILPALAADFRVVAYDRAGLGASDPSGRRLTIDSQVDDLVALLDARGPALLVGHSWGGLLAQHAAAARPGQVAGVVLVDPTHEEVMAALPKRLQLGSEVILGWIVALKAVGRFDKWLDKHARGLADRCTDDPAIRELLVTAYHASYAGIAQVAAIRAENRLASAVPAARRARATLVPPDVPMTILTATRDKPPNLQIRSAELADETAAAYPRGQHIVIDDSGHYIHHDQPAATVAAIKSAAG